MTDGSTAVPTANDAPLQLRGAQARIRDAYFQHESGLFVVNCLPGIGKTVVATSLPARELLERFVAGDPTPDRHLCIMTFNRDEAADLVPSIIARIRELVEHEMTPAAREISAAELEQLVTRVRQSEFIGTIDGVLRGVFRDIFGDLGFDELPSVGNSLQLERLHAECFDAIESDPAYASALATVRAAYPAGEYEDGPADLLRQAHEHCQSRRKSADVCHGDLLETVSAVYKEGTTTSFQDLQAALARCVGEEEAARVAEALDSDARERLAGADQQLHEAWRDTIEAFGTLLDAYRSEYETRAREHGVISHTDCAALVAGFLSGELATTDAAEAKRRRVLARYHDLIESVVIDEAQDVSRIQHEALTPLITEDCRVLATGDLRQSIYVWRDADPSIFASAAEDGTYLGTEWASHVTETATTTYRSTADIATAINAIADPALTGAQRGNSGSLDITYPHLETARDATPGASVHIATVTSSAPPAADTYVTEERSGEADKVATYLATGLADGTLTTEDEGTPSVAVLFRWRRHMDAYADAFEAEGLTVANASKHLFDHPAVEIVLDTIEWLATPADTTPLASLLGESTAGLDDLEAILRAHDWHLDDLPEESLTDLGDQDRAVLDALHQLRDDLPTFRARSASYIVPHIIETLALRADPHGITGTTDAPRRVATLDRFVELLADWGGETGFDLRDLPEAFASFREQPRTGPSQPLTSTDHDVIFTTIHRAKGDEYDIVVPAALGENLRKHGPTAQRFEATGPMAGLAPPLTAAAPDIDELSVFSRGLYDPTGDTPGDSQRTPIDVGFRWASEHRASAASDPALIGHDHLQAAVRAKRSEAWRTLYVALTRAQNHLVIPLPRTIPGTEQPYDRWLDTIKDSLQFDDTRQGDSYTLDPPSTTCSITIGVNDVDPSTHQSPPTTSAPATYVTTTLPDRQALPPLIPRFLQPSSLYPLTESPVEHTLTYLQAQSIETETGTVAEDLPLTFDAVHTDTVGQFVHSVLTTAVQADLSSTALRTHSEALQLIVDAKLQRFAPHAPPAEREELVQYLIETIIPQFLQSKLWQALQRATTVSVEKPLRDHLRVDTTEFELVGHADFVIQNPDDSWTITDLKVALADPSDALRRRYELQVTAYAHLLDGETSDDSQISSSIETVGEVQYRNHVTWPHSIVQRRVRAAFDLPRSAGE